MKYCHKLTAIGLGKNSVDWFKSYLSNRSQFVELDGIRSSEQSITCGVPQGSILGPLPFLLYVNDMISAIDGSCKLYLYGDDSILSDVGKKVDEIEMALSRNMESVRIWLLRNKLSLHLGKTESILFGSPSQTKKKHSLKVICDNIMLDNNLNGKLMCENAINKIN